MVVVGGEEVASGVCVWCPSLTASLLMMVVVVGRIIRGRVDSGWDSDTGIIVDRGGVVIEEEGNSTSGGEV